MWPFTRRFPPLSRMPEECWSVGVGSEQSRPLFVRLNTWARRLRGHPEYPWRIGISAPIPEDYDLPLTNQPESPYHQLELRASALLTAGEQSVHVATLTGGASPVTGGPYR